MMRLSRCLNEARYRLGRWLIRPEAARVIVHYDNVIKQTDDARMSERLSYIIIGAKYVANGWSGQEGQ